MDTLVPFTQLSQRFKNNRAVRTANVVLVIASALTTASLALVTQDLLPKPDPDARIVGWRWLVFAVAVVLVCGSVYWRTNAQRSTGTLFYVQMLDEGMADQRLQALRTAAKKQLARRSITRWLDLRGGTVNGVIDVHPQCQEAGTALEELVNNDRDDTAYTVAPNALWPMAMALGTHLPAGDQLKVTELPDGTGVEQETFRLRTETKPAELYVEHAELDGATGDRVGVWLAFTPAKKDFDADWFRAFGVSTAYTMTWDGVDPAEGSVVRYQRDELERLAAGIAKTLAELKRTHKDSEFVVIAMIPKAVALAVGWHLAQHDCAFFRDTHLMHFDRDYKDHSNYGYFPMRVRGSQPSTTPTAGELSTSN